MAARSSADIVTEADRLARLVGDLLQLAADRRDRRSSSSAQPVDLGDDRGRHRPPGRGARAPSATSLSSSAPTHGGSAIVAATATGSSSSSLILLDNAFDHSPPGGDGHGRCPRAGRDVELSVADEGPGDPAAERERIFEPFTRLPGVAPRPAGGTGLGLAIARRIATAHGGTIAVDDAPGGGAAFVVTIPAVDRRRLPPAAHRPRGFGERTSGTQDPRTARRRRSPRQQLGTETSIHGGIDHGLRHRRSPASTTATSRASRSARSTASAPTSASTASSTSTRTAASTAARARPPARTRRSSAPTSSRRRGPTSPGSTRPGTATPRRRAPSS